MILANFFAKAMQEFSGWRKDWVQVLSNLHSFTKSRNLSSLALYQHLRCRTPPPPRSAQQAVQDALLEGLPGLLHSHKGGRSRIQSLEADGNTRRD